MDAAKWAGVASIWVDYGYGNKFEQNVAITDYIWTLIDE